MCPLIGWSITRLCWMTEKIKRGAKQQKHYIYFKEPWAAPLTFPKQRNSKSALFHTSIQRICVRIHPFPSSGDLPDPGIKPRSPTLQADSLQSEPLGKPCSVS